MENVGKNIGGRIIPSGKGKVIDLARRLRRAQQIAKIGYWELSLVDDQHFWSEEIIELLGSKKNGKTFDEKFFFKHIHPSDTTKLKDGLRAASRNCEQIHVIQLRIIQFDTQEVKNVEAKFVGATENGVDIIRIEGTLQNVDERINALQSLHESKVSLHKAFEVANLGSYKYEVAKDHLIWSEEAIHVAEFTNGNVPETIEAFFELIHPEDVDVIRNGASQTTASYEYRLYGQNGYKWIHSHMQRFYNKEGDTEYVIGVIQDITQFKLEELKKEAYAKQLRTGAELAQLGHWIFDVKTSKYTFNDQFYKVYKTSAEEVGGYELTFEEYKNLFFLKEEEELEENLSQSVDFFQSNPAKTTRELKHKVKFFDGSIGYIGVRTMPIYDEQGELTQIIGTNQNITDLELNKQQLHRVLTELETNYYQLKIGADLARIGFWSLDLKQNEFTFNEQFYSMHKTSVERVGSYTLTSQEYIEKFCIDIDVNKVVDLFIKKFSTDGHSKPQRTTHHVVFGDGKAGIVEVLAIPILNTKGQIIQLVGANQDITEREQNKQNLEQALHEKVTLLSEVHHRVKNNLALISGLLQLQSMFSEKEALNEKLQQSTTRIKSIALVHELLYQSSHLTSINIKDYLHKVIPTLESTYSPKNIPIEMLIQADDHEININQAVPVGLLLNELITNSYQYAFVGRTEGQIIVSLRVTGEDVIMSYKDDGRGFDPSFSLDKVSSLGFTLIKSQLEQLGAEYELNSKDGFSLSFTFRETERGSHSMV